MHGRYLIPVTAIVALLLGTRLPSFAVEAHPPKLGGPLRLVDQTPTQLLFLQHFPDVAGPVSAGRLLLHWNTALTNTIIWERSGEVTEHTNIEMVRTVLDLRRGLFSGVEAGIEVPFLYIYGGALDGFIRWVERVVGDEQASRKDGKDEDFVYQVKHNENGSVLVESEEDTLGLGDIALKVKARLCIEGDWLPAVSARASLKLPTGDDSRALGSGRTDWGAGLLLEKSFAAWTFYVNGDVLAPGDAFGDQGFNLRPYLSAMGAAEFRVSEPLGVVAQVRTDTQVLHRKQVTDVLLGLNWAPAPDLSFQFGFAEDVLDSGPHSADVSFFFNASRRW